MTLTDPGFPPPDTGPMLKARSIAFVGGSARSLSVRGMSESLQRDGFSGPIFMVNPNQGVATFAMLIMMGLVCGLIGDIVLDLKIMYKESSSLYQHGGMVAFLVGHLFYLAALIIYFGFSWIPVVIALVLAIIIAGVSKFILKFNFAEHSIDTYAYSFILSYMMTQACYAAITQGFTACTILIAAGSILFLLSDLVLVMTYYDNKDSRPFIAVNHILYYAAEFSIALSILYFVVW